MKRYSSAGIRIFSISLVLSLAILMLTACVQGRVMPSNEELGRMVSFSYGWGHDHGSEEYQITVTDTGVEYMKFVFNKPEHDSVVLLPGETADDLSELIRLNQIWSWNGFDKTQQGIADGFGFHLEVVYENRTLYSRGYGYTPQGFEEGSEAIEEFFADIERRIANGEF